MVAKVSGRRKRDKGEDNICPQRRMVEQYVDVQIQEWKKGLAEKRSKEILTLEEETARLLIEIEKKGFEQETALHSQRLEQIEREREERLKMAKDNPELEKAVNDNADAKKQKEDFDFVSKMTEKYATYTEKRIELEKRFNDEIASMQKKNEEAAKKGLKPEFTQEQIELAKQMRTKALAQLDDEVMKSSNILVRMFSDTRKKSSKELEALKKEVEEFIAYLSSGEFKEVGNTGLDIWGNTREQFENLIDPDKLKELKEQLKDITEECGNFDNELQTLVKNYKKFLEATKTGNSKDVEKAFLNLAASMKKVGLIAVDVGKNIVESFKGISPELDKQIQGFEEFSNMFSTIGQRAGQGASAGGPVGAILGAMLGILEHGIKSINKAKKEDAEEEAKRVQQRLDTENLIYNLYKQRFSLSKKIGETELDYLERCLKVLQEQLKTYKNIEEVETGRRDNPTYKLVESGYLKSSLDKLMKSTFMDYEEKEIEKSEEGHRVSMEGGVSSVNRKGTVKKKFSDKLKNGLDSSYEEMEDMIIDLLKQGLITVNDTLYKDWEKYSQYYKEYLDLKKEEEEIQARIKEAYVGTTYQGLLDSIVNAFRDGNYAAEDFANNFSDIMKNAMLNMLGRDISDAAGRMFDRLSKIMMSYDNGEDLPEEYKGKSWDEIVEMLQAEYVALGEMSAEKYEALKKIFGVDFDSRIGGAQAQGFAAASQDSISELNGRFAAMLIHTTQIADNLRIMADNMQNQLGYLRQIADNTFKLHEMARELSMMRTLWVGIETFGLIIKS